MNQRYNCIKYKVIYIIWKYIKWIKRDIMKRGKKAQGQEQVELAELKTKALELRKQNLNYVEIGKRLGICKSTAHNYVTDTLREMPEEKAEELRDLIKMQYIELCRDWQEMAHNGDEKAATIYLKAMADMRKMLGLDAPVRSEIDGNISTPATVIINLGEQQNEDC